MWEESGRSGWMTGREERDECWKRKKWMTEREEDECGKRGTEDD